MYFKKKSSRMQRQEETPQGQNTMIPCAFLLFLIFPHPSVPLGGCQAVPSKAAGDLLFT